MQQMTYVYGPGELCAGHPGMVIAAVCVLNQWCYVVGLIDGSRTESAIGEPNAPLLSKAAARDAAFGWLASKE